MALTPTAAQLAILQLNQAMLGQAAGTTILAAALPTFTTANAYAKTLFDANSAWNTLDATQAYTKLVTSLAAGTAATAADINALVTAVVAETGSTKLLKTIPEGLSLLTAAFYNFATSTTTNVWTDAAKQLVNKVTADAYYTLDKGYAAASTAVPQYVTADATSVTYVTTSLDQGVIPSGAKTFTLTAGADTAPAFTGSPYADIYTATGTTLTAGDYFDAGAGIDTMNVSATANANLGAFFISSLEKMNFTGDVTGDMIADMSGVTGLTDVTVNNSSRVTTLNQNTSIFNLELNNLTVGAGVALHYRDTVLTNTNDSQNITLNSVNIINNNTGVIQVGGTTVANAGVETVNLTVAGSAARIDQLDSNLTTLNITGDKDLTITAALNATATTVNAAKMSGALNLNLTNAGATAVTYTGSTGADTVTFLGTTGKNVINTQGGNDSVTAGLGQENINLGDGTDTLVFTTTNGIPLTVADTVEGGAGVDTVRFDGTNGANISRSEAQRMTGVEVVTFNQAGTAATATNLIVVTDSLINTAENKAFTVNNTSSVLNTTVNLSELTVPVNGGFTFNGGANADIVIARDQQVNSLSTLTFGTGTDILQVIDGANLTADDFSKITGLEKIELRSSTNTKQDWVINLPANNTVTEVYIDNDVPQGSTLTITNAGTTAVVVRTNSNTVVNGGVNTFTNGTVVSNLEYTLNTDLLPGAQNVSDVFLAEQLAMVQLADRASGSGYTAAGAAQADTAAGFSTGAGTNGFFTHSANDTLQLNFAVFNTSDSLWNQLSKTQLSGIETINFCEVNSPVSTAANAANAANTTLNVAMYTPGLTSAFSVGGVQFGTSNASDVTINFGSGADQVTSGAESIVYNMGDGNDAYSSADNTWAGSNAGGAARSGSYGMAGETVNMGNGNDTFTFDTNELTGGRSAGWTATNVFQSGTFDSLNGGAGTDTLNLTTSAGGAGTGYLYTLGNNTQVASSTVDAVTFTNDLAYLSGIDAVTYTATTGHTAAGLVVTNEFLASSDTGSVAFTVRDANAGVNTVSIFDASSVVTGRSVYATVNGPAASAQGIATHWADVMGGAGNDSLTITGSVGGAGSAFSTANAATTAINDNYVVQGNAGYDLINITNGGLRGVGVRFNAPNDGATSGVSGTGAATATNLIGDFITGFHSTADSAFAGHTDALLFNIDNFGAATNVNVKAVASGGLAQGITKSAGIGGQISVGGVAVGGIDLYVRTDGAINITNAADNAGYLSANALRMSQLNTGFTDADLTNLTAVAARANVIGIQSAATNGAVIIANGQNQSAIYYFVEDGLSLNNVSVGELKILGIVDNNHVAGDVATGARNYTGDLIFV